MLPYTLVLLLATSTLAQPTANLIPYSWDDLPSVPDNGRLVNEFVVKEAFSIFDAAELNLYETDLVDYINSLAIRSRNPTQQASAVLLTISVLGEAANAIPGDVCEAAAVINAFESGDKARLDQASASYLNHIASYIDNIVELTVKPDKRRNSVGPRGSCFAGGRSYDFDGVWDRLIAADGNLQEEYCSTKRLHTALNGRSNNVAAAVTASAIAPVSTAFQRAMLPVAQFLRAVASNANPARAGAEAKKALRRAL